MKGGLGMQKVAICRSSICAALTLVLCAGWSTAVSSDDEQLPGGRPEDVSLAINNPDEYAWRLFLAINRQAAVGRIGEPDPKFPITKYTDDVPVVWETWAL